MSLFGQQLSCFRRWRSPLTNNCNSILNHMFFHRIFLWMMCKHRCPLCSFSHTFYVAVFNIPTAANACYRFIIFKASHHHHCPLKKNPCPFLSFSSPGWLPGAKERLCWWVSARSAAALCAVQSNRTGGLPIAFEHVARWWIWPGTSMG